MSSPVSFHPLGTPQPASATLDRIADIDPRLTRSHFFDGRLLTAEDLIRDQIYLDQRLREVGRTLGTGVVNGLDLTFDDVTGSLRLNPGSGVTSAGRTLELNSDMRVELGDRALISSLNEGRNRRFNRGLYAVVLLHAEEKNDIAEVFPTDLGADRGVEADVVSETVQLGLVPLPQPLPQQSGLHTRANLIREFNAGSQAAAIVPEDGIGLGVLAVAEDRAIWLDSTILRLSTRDTAQTSLQTQLTSSHEALYDDVIAYRRSGALSEDFAAAEYFRILPPAGRVPKASIDPELGRQGFFPEDFRVSVAPIRFSDVEAISEESMRLPPIDLSNNEPVEVVVLAPLGSKDYAFFAGALERPFDPATRLLKSQDLLDVYRHPRRPVHQLDTDAAAWRAIWDRIGSDSVLYVRRPTRAAETSLSGIVLARGTSLPAAPTGGTATPADGGTLLQSEDAVFLNRVNLTRLGDQRRPAVTAGETALSDMVTEFGADPDVVNASLTTLLLVERRYDGIVWQSLLALARSGNLSTFASDLRIALDGGALTSAAVASVGPALGLADPIVNAWEAVDVV